MKAIAEAHVEHRYVEVFLVSGIKLTGYIESIGWGGEQDSILTLEMEPNQHGDQLCINFANVASVMVKK